ncbi:MAG: sugar kinase [Roseiflexaceae bacterium]|mgnify:CR=1 FL=1|nr:sugar kinase [Roseiflexaceae bacterium]
MIDVVTLGECMAVCYPADPIRLDDARTLLLDIGGAEANLSIALARLGIRARFISRVGDDPFGQRIRSVLKQEGVDVTGIITDPQAPTGMFFREWLPDGARRVYYYRAHSAASRMQPTDLQPEQFTGARFVHLTGITPALSQTCAATVMQAIKLAQAAGAQVSFDPNYRPKLWEPDAARVALLPIIQQCDVLLMGHEDARAVLGVDDDEQMLQSAAALGPRIVVLKRAERGALALADGIRYEAPAIAVEHVVDPVGAGDGFDAGFLAGMLRGDTISEALNLGALVGAASVAALGDYAGYPCA